MPRVHFTGESGSYTYDSLKQLIAAIQRRGSRATNGEVAPVTRAPHDRRGRKPHEPLPSSESDSPMKHGAEPVNDLGFLALPIGAVALSYFDTGASLLWASAAALAVAAVMARKAELFLTDWGVALALLYEMLSLAVSQYAANGLPFAKVVSSAAACYFLVPLSAATASRMAALSLLVGSGGAALAWRGLTQANEHAGVLRDNGFQDIVAFRARLISPPAPWVAGEWFTLLLMTLPFACALAAFCWLRWRRRWALAAVALPVRRSLHCCFPARGPCSGR